MSKNQSLKFREIVALVKEELKKARAWAGSQPPVEAKAQRDISHRLQRIVLGILSEHQRDVTGCAKRVGLAAAVNRLENVGTELEELHDQGKDVFDIETTDPITKEG